MNEFVISTVLKRTKKETITQFKRLISSSFSAFSNEESVKNSKTRDHMKRTENIPREKPLCSATVVNVEDLSPNVKGLTLFVEENVRHLSKFKAGQWVDMFIPQVDTVGGFSICNSPKDLLQNGKLELAVKFSDHPPAFWVHSKCNVGDEVKVRVGGNFYTSVESGNNLLLVAGGVGINPLLSIFQHQRDLIMDNSGLIHDKKISLVYSAKTYKELIFKDKIEEICNEIGAHCHYHITKEKSQGNWPILSDGLTYAEEKISQVSLNHAISVITPVLNDTISTDCYICGPPPFIERIESYLLNLKIPKSQIFYEKWW